MPNLTILAGPNGAGKTTLAQTLLPDQLRCREFVNADEIARGLSPFNAEAQAMQAGRLMLKRMDDLLAKGEDFAFETTLATRGFDRLIKRAQHQGYHVRLIFLTLQDVPFAKARVAKRVRAGGHAIDEVVIERRFKVGLNNLLNRYVMLVDQWDVYDNSQAIPKLLACGSSDSEEVADATRWQQLKQMAV